MAQKNCEDANEVNVLAKLNGLLSRILLTVVHEEN